jgi:hypothetical protein
MRFFLNFTKISLLKTAIELDFFKKLLQIMHKIVCNGRYIKNTIQSIKFPGLDFHVPSWTKEENKKS